MPSRPIAKPPIAAAPTASAPIASAPRAWAPRAALARKGEVPRRPRITPNGSAKAEMSAAGSVRLRKHVVDRLLEGRQVTLDNLEHTMDVDPEVLVGDQVAESGDVGPGDIGC